MEKKSIHYIFLLVSFLFATIETDHNVFGMVHAMQNIMMVITLMITVMILVFLRSA
jgi:uncharacterized membrane protein